MDEKTRGRLLLSIAFMAFLAIGLPNGALNVAWIHMQQSFGVSLDSLGVLLGAITVGRLVMSFYSGRLIAWMTIGRFLLGGSAVMLAGLVGMTVAEAWPVLVLAAVVFGTGGGALNAGVNTFAAARFNSSRMNWLHAWYGVGSAVGPLLVTVVVIDMGQDWRWAYGILVALQLLLTLTFILTRPAWRLEDHGEKPTADAPRVRARDTLRMGAVWFGIMLFFLHGGIQVGTGQLSNSLFVEGRGIDARTVGTWISVYWACLTAGRIFTGLFVERVGNALFLRISMFVTVVGALLVWWHGSDLLSFVGVALLGFSLGPVLPTILADTPQRTGRLHAPNAVGFQIAASGVGLALLPGAAAWVAERAGLETISLYLLALAVLSFVIHEWMVLRESRQHVSAPQPH